MKGQLRRMGQCFQEIIYEKDYIVTLVILLSQVSQVSQPVQVSKLLVQCVEKLLITSPLTGLRTARSMDLGFDRRAIIMVSWRWRRCPNCTRVLPAGALIQVEYGSHWNRGGSSQRQCPQCGFLGYTYQFKVVREKHNA